MKKIFTTIFVMCMALGMHASLHLTIEQEVGEELVITEITKDTTIVVTEFEYDEDMDEATMGVKGTLYSDESKNIAVAITRSAAGIFDQFCAAGNCVPGNGEEAQELSFTIGESAMQRSWFTHYYPVAVGIETITYAFNDGVNPVVTLTVEYDYSGTAVEDVVATPTDNTIYSLLGQRMQTTNLSELPKGIYIINGKKYIKQ